MFEEIRTEKARKLLDARALGFSQIRLLPKASGLRPIMNLRRRATKVHGGKTILGRSINSVMAPVYNMLNYEKSVQPDRLASALFSVGDIYLRLKDFRAQLSWDDREMEKLFFVKADVQSCFDTIPQRRVVRLMEQLCSESEYRIARHAEIKPSEPRSYQGGSGPVCKPARKFVARARPGHDFSSFQESVIEDIGKKKKNTIYVDSVVEALQGKEQLLDLLEEHVECNVVKIGKKFFRQKRGIPQGSVLSSLLCSFFYADFQREHLGFLNNPNTLLLRLIDDFLLITTNKADAMRFLGVMEDGNEEYGIKIKMEKTLANFDTTPDKMGGSCQASSTNFPYCGIRIDTRTLEVTKDRARRTDTGRLLDLRSQELDANLDSTGRFAHSGKIKSAGKDLSPESNAVRMTEVDLPFGNGLTQPPRSSAFKLQIHVMFLDTSLTSLATVRSTIYQNLLESAMKLYRYAKSMAKGRPPGALLRSKSTPGSEIASCTSIFPQPACSCGTNNFLRDNPRSRQTGCCPRSEQT